MFKRFFNALAGLTAAVDALTASVTEANANFRANLGLDGPADVPVDGGQELSHFRGER